MLPSKRRRKQSNQKEKFKTDEFLLTIRRVLLYHVSYSDGGESVPLQRRPVFRSNAFGLLKYNHLFI